MLLIRLNGTTRRIWLRETGTNTGSFKSPRYIRAALQTKGDFSIIRLNDSRRMVIVTDQRKLPVNELATEMVHQLTEQKTAVIRGLAIIASLQELGTAN